MKEFWAGVGRLDELWIDHSGVDEGRGLSFASETVMWLIMGEIVCSDDGGGESVIIWSNRGEIQLFVEYSLVDSSCELNSTGFFVRGWWLLVQNLNMV